MVAHTQEPAADVQIRGLPGDEASIMSIAVTRSISIPLLFQAAADLRCVSMSPWIGHAL